MKLDCTKYLELVVRHKNATLDEFPSRFCVIRIPFDKIDFSNDIPISLSLGQLKKFYSIGLYKALHSVDLSVFSYCIVPRRPFDKTFVSQYPEFSRIFFRSIILLYEHFASFFK